MIYLVILLLLLLLTYVYDFHKIDTDDSSIYWGVCGLLILIAALRFRVGGDTLGYIEDYKSIPKMSDLTLKYIKSQDYQPLWLILNSFCKTFTDSFVLFQFIHAFIINITIFAFLKNHTPYPFLGVVFYFIFYYLYFNMEVLREALAISIFLISYKAFINKKWIWYYVGVLVAFFFHLSAIILIIFPLFRTKLSFKTFLISLVLISVIFSFFRNEILDIILSFVTNEKLTWAIITYLRAEINLNGVILILASKVFTPLLFLYLSEIKLDYKPEMKTLIYIYIMLSLVSIYIEPFYRFTNYLTPFLYLFMVNVLYRVYISDFFFRLRQPVIAFLICIPMIFQSYYFLRDTSDIVPDTKYYNVWIPYNSVLHKVENEKRETLVRELTHW